MTLVTADPREDFIRPVARANSTAIGFGATTTRANQTSFGTATNTYTMGGIASDASRAVQQGPLETCPRDKPG